MKRQELKVARIGNSRGVRIPAVTLERYRIGDTVIMEERADGILLRPSRAPGAKLSWKDTADAMAAAGEDWREWDTVNSDGLDDVPWDVPPATRVAEPSATFDAITRRPRRTTGT